MSHHWIAESNQCDFYLPPTKSCLHKAPYIGKTAQTCSVTHLCQIIDERTEFEEFTKQMRKTLFMCCQGVAVLEEMAS